MFSMFVLLKSNHTVFLVQFEINLHLWVFQKAEIALVEAARAISAFWKTHSCKLIPNWTRNRMITHANIRSANKFKWFVESRVPNSPVAKFAPDLTAANLRWQKQKHSSPVGTQLYFFHFHLLYCCPAWLPMMSCVCKPRILNLTIIDTCFMFWLLVQWLREC